MAADGVLLIAFGGPRRPEEIRPFLARVAHGRSIPEARLEEAARHYEAIGGRSPLADITFRQAAALARALAAAGRPLPVHVGMRNWAPSLLDALADMARAGLRRAVGVILAPHATAASRARYLEAVDAARARLGAAAPDVVYVRAWHTHPRFVEAVADGVRAALAAVPPGARLLFTAHSVPAAMAEASPYVAEIAATAAAVAATVGATRWQVAYQSRSGSPGEAWLEPDVNDALRALAAAGPDPVVVVPVGFVCDHVEVLYDLDVEARATAAALGLPFARAATVNDHPAFVGMLAELVLEAAG
jgi:ferrochelatase